MSDNLFLEDLLELLSGYGRPRMNQFALSATPGLKVAGLWGCEVSIRPKPDDQLSVEDREFRYQKHFSVVSARMIGSGETPRSAAAACLAECQRLMESDVARFYQPVSVSDAKKEEELPSP